MSVEGTALAGAVIAAALFDVLVESNMLTKDEARAVIARAWERLALFDGPEKVEAAKVVQSLVELASVRDFEP